MLRLGTHSFRIGAVSTAATLGYHPDDIKCLECWYPQPIEDTVVPRITTIIRPTEITV